MIVEVLPSPPAKPQPLLNSKPPPTIPSSSVTLSALRAQTLISVTRSPRQEVLQLTPTLLLSSPSVPVSNIRPPSTLEPTPSPVSTVLQPTQMLLSLTTA